MLALERRNKIVQIINKQKQLSIKQLSADLKVSEGTLRNDLKALEEEGLLERTHGGAVLPKQQLTDTSFRPNRQEINVAEKMAIGKAAADLIQNGQCIILDASTTGLELVSNLMHMESLTVVTNGLITAQELNRNPHINVIVIGGVLRSGSSNLEGLLGKDLLSQIHADIFFTSAHGFTITEGLTVFDVYEAELKKLMASNANKVVAMVDHTKLGKRSTATFANLSQIDTIITDSAANLEFLEQIKGVEVIIAN
ncbi:DeoR family transcriptional regulator [Paenibacillus baekrokdamisoli]|uniref:DeoR family transcriptional regulator n=1 Tax=Paenibacillus baekrokdamisoli TaxID=1712516 RepID=A0A3G9JN69_9BACL|nr:DeoR/GlpR family DNA-binding transcription regulator [Paenibacillus baekrokdamisoli]MBB3071480.1 DeoR/GlpR family transcriptional regulator of sugar metabolism [Paenibacillus baekrokdamisoli]BBH24489.1 DeoR family transcriptional regulator [Paenibacillus baekrokdamisoli]